MNSIEISWSGNYVFLSYIFAFAGSFIGVCLGEQYRQCVISHPQILGANTILWLMALSIGGVAIWSMHFIGMGAMILLNVEDGEIIKVEFDVILTIVSLVVGIIFVYAGLLIATSDRVYMKNQQEFDAMMIADAGKLSIKEAKSKQKLKFLALFKGLSPLVIGGVVAAGGICVMHYVGMMAQIFKVHMSWQPGIISLSVIIAVVASIAAFWIMFRLLPIFPQYESLRIACAFIMGIAVCGMHYCGIYGPKYLIRTTATPTYTVGLDSNSSVLSALAFGMIVLIIIHILSYAEIKSRLTRASLVIKKIDVVFNDLKISSVADTLQPYFIRYDGAVLLLTRAKSFRRSTIANKNTVVQRTSIVNIRKLSSKKIFVGMSSPQTRNSVELGMSPQTRNSVEVGMSPQTRNSVEVGMSPQTRNSVENRYLAENRNSIENRNSVDCRNSIIEI